MGNSAFARTNFDVLGEFAFSSFKNCTVKCLDNEVSSSQGHFKYISIGKIS